MHWAAIHDQHHVIEHMLKVGAHVDAVNSVSTHCQRTHLGRHLPAKECARSLGDSCDPACSILRHGGPGADTRTGLSASVRVMVSQHEMTTLHQSARSGDLKSVKILLAAGAQVDAKDKVSGVARALNNVVRRFG